MIPEIPEEFEHARQFCLAWQKGDKTFSIKTSGSTGKPKIIELSRTQMEASAIMTGKALGIKAGDKSLLCLNTQYIGGIMMLVRAMVLDLDLIIVPPSSNPLENLEKKIKIDFAALVPLQLYNILKKTPAKVEMLNNMKAIIVGGAPVNEELKKLSKSIKSPVYNTYGMTETVSHIALSRINGKNEEGIFTALKGVHLALDQRGCLTISAPSTDYKEVVTNDVVDLIDSNKFIWKGRVDNVINSGGIKIFPEELEKKISVIFKNEQIDCPYFISSRPDDLFGNKLILVTERAENLKKIEDLLKSKLSKYEVPKEIHNLPEFCYTDNGKINRNKTKELLFKD